MPEQRENILVLDDDMVFTAVLKRLSPQNIILLSQTAYHSETSLKKALAVEMFHAIKKVFIYCLLKTGNNKRSDLTGFDVFRYIVYEVLNFEEIKQIAFCFYSPFSEAEICIPKKARDLIRNDTIKYIQISDIMEYNKLIEYIM